MKLDIQLSTRAGSVRSWRIMIDGNLVGWVSYDEGAVVMRRWQWSTNVDDLAVTARDRDDALAKLLADRAEELRSQATKIEALALGTKPEWPAFPNT